MDRDALDEEIDAPPAPTYEEAPEEALDNGLVTPDGWQNWPLWAKMRLLRRLRTDGAGRPEQYIDDALAWYLWAMWGGRGSGKSDEASRWSAEDALRLDKIRFALIGRTFSDVRDTMFEGETGLLALIPDWALKGGSRERAYNRSLGELFLANGSKFKGFSSEKPNQLRGPQHHRAWIDEASSWADADEGNVVDTTISNLMLGLRLKCPDGSRVRMVSSTTPKPNELTEFLNQLAEEKGQVRVLSTYSNLANLDEEVADIVIGLYEGTDVAAQELEGKILSATKGAAWDYASIEVAKTVKPRGDLDKTVLGIDPAVTSKSGSDETGLVVVVRNRETVVDQEGKQHDDYWINVEADLSGVIPVSRFPHSVMAAVVDYNVDDVLVEVNNGYDFVVSAITSHIEAEGGLVIKRTRTDHSSIKTKSRKVTEYICSTEDGHAFTLKPVWQSVDKLTRAKAVSIWWHRKRASHAEGLDKLEKQMCTYDGTARKSPDRLDALTTAVAGLAVRQSRRERSGASTFTASPPPPPGSPQHPLLVTASAGPTVDSPWDRNI